MKSKTGSVIILGFVILAAVVVGGLVGDLTKNISFLHWLGYSKSIGISVNDPFILDLSIMKFSFGFEMGINIVQIIFLTIAVFIYRKIR